jgi:hypothetical protein
MNTPDPAKNSSPTQKRFSLARINAKFFCPFDCDDGYEHNTRDLSGSTGRLPVRKGRDEKEFFGMAALDLIKIETRIEKTGYLFTR